MLAIATIGYISVNEDGFIPNQKKIQNAIREKIFEIWDEKEELCLITGLARGTDQLFCEIGAKLKKEYAKKTEVKIIAVLPYEKQAALWPQAVQTFYSSLLKKVDEVECLNQGKFNLGYVKQRNEKMIDYADYVIFTEHNHNVDFYKKYAESNNKKYTILDLTSFVVKKKNTEENNGKAN